VGEKEIPTQGTKLLIKENGFGDNADGVVSDDDSAGDEIARTFGADCDAVCTHRIQVCFDPLLGSAGVYLAAKKEAELANGLSELLVEEE
jgi:hypothetical protein